MKKETLEKANMLVQKEASLLSLKKEIESSSEIVVVLENRDRRIQTISTASDSEHPFAEEAKTFVKDIIGTINRRLIIIEEDLDSL